jgi:hypothetical protein
MVLKWAGAKSIADGLKTGAVFGVLLASGMDLGFWAMTKMYNSFAVLVVDVVVYTLMMSVVGLLIVLLWGKDTPA